MDSRLRLIRVENYRCFREPFELQLRPLTFVYGWNNSGKSAASRLVKLLGDSVREAARAPLDPVGGPTYRNLVWKPAVAKPGPLRFELEWSGGDPESAKWRLDFDRDKNRMYVRELDVVEQAGSTRSVSALPADDHDLFELGGTDQGQLELHFNGLIPDGPLPWMTALATRLKEIRGSFRWLAGDRVVPPRFVQAGEPAPLDVATDGVGATELLLADPDLLETVAAWYARPPISRRLSRKEQEATARLVLDPEHAKLDIDLADAGAGMGQILPVITQIALARRLARSGKQAAVAIEEPESQLHTNAQRLLGEWLCEVAAEPLAPSLVLETHSRVLVLATQVAIARGDLDPSRVAVYWLEQRDDGSTAWELVEFDDSGRPGAGWPRDVFADEVDLAEALAAEQLGGLTVKLR